MKKSLLTIVVGLLIASVPMAFAMTALFTDVPEESWYTEAVYNLKDKGIIAGYPDGTFRPGENVSRAEVAVMLNSMLRYIEIPKNWQEFATNDFIMQVPEHWEIQKIQDVTNYTTEFFDITTNKIAATFDCPIPETGWEAWTFETSSRPLESADADSPQPFPYYADLWIGTPNEDADVAPLDLIFMHRNEFANWFGDEESDDAMFSCYFSVSPGQPLISQGIYDSIKVR